MGFSGSPSGGAHIVFRICDNTGTVVYTEQNLPTTSPGYISTLSQACNGPNQLLSPPGNTGIYSHYLDTPSGRHVLYRVFSENSGGSLYIINFQLICSTLPSIIMSQLSDTREIILSKLAV